jgi:hypothetical protein
LKDGRAWAWRLQVGHAGGVPPQEAHAAAVAADRHVLAEPRSSVGRGGQAVAEPEVMARCIRTAADDKPGGERREGN